MTNTSNNTKTLAIAAMLIFNLFAFSRLGFAQFGGGTGAYNNPYIIETTDHWLELAASVNSGNDYYGKHFYLLNDLDFSGINFIPVGGALLDGDFTHFAGTFDGGYSRILNVQVGGNRNVGLFGSLGFSTVKNLTLGGNSRIEGQYFVGGIVGMAGTCDIINCHVEKTVTIAATTNQSSYIGGIIGSCYNGVSGNGCEIRDCTNAATVTNNGKQGVKYIGGIAGNIASRGQSIRDCKNYGAVSGYEYVGGIVGYFNFDESSNTLENCYTGAYCTLFGVGQSGSSQGINLPGQAVSMHTITFGENVHGLVNVIPTAAFEGQNYYAAGMQIILNLYPDTGAPEGYIPLFDVNGEPQRPGYDIGMTMPAENVTITVGGTLRDIGYSPWFSVSLDPESFEYNGSVQVPNVTVTDIKDGNFVTLTEGIDYEVWLSYLNPINPGTYKININGLGNFAGTTEAWYSITPPSAYWIGEGTAESPYLIYTTDDMQRLATRVSGGITCEGEHFSLQNDLDYSGKGFWPIGAANDRKAFKGTFNGNGHTISHVVMQGSDNFRALFGYIGEGGVVSGLTLGEGSSIEGQRYIGGIAAECYGTVSDCGTAEGVTIRANIGSAGGIVYRLYSTGRILNSQNRANVSTETASCGGIVAVMEYGEVSGCINYGSVEAGTLKAGGIVGDLTYEGIVTNCVNEGSVSGSENVGGIVGFFGRGSLSDCLNLGAVSASGNSYVGGVAGRIWNGSASNNYYAGACNVGGIDGSDVAGQAMRGYTIEVQHPLGISLEGSIGLFYEGKVYAGENQEVIVGLEVNGSSYVPQCLSFSAGTYNNNDDGTCTVTMPVENITVSGNIVEIDGLHYELSCDGSNTATVIQNDAYASTLEDNFAVPYGFTLGETYYEVVAIGPNAFEGCTGITELYLNENMADIGSEAFKNCTGLTKITPMPLVPPTAAEDAFSGVPTDIPVEVAFCSQYDYSVAMGWSGFSDIQGTGPCEHTFMGMEDNLWSNPNNWVGGLPDANSTVGIYGECEIDEVVTVKSVTIGDYANDDDGVYDRLTVKNGATLTATDFIYTVGDATHFVIEDGAQVVHPNAGAKATVQRNISAYNPSANPTNGWHLIGYSFLGSGAVDEMDNLLENTYDLYYYDEPTHYWKNHKKAANNFTELVAAKGYLYANSASQTIGLKGTLEAGDATVNVPLSYASVDGKRIGFNLVGNPFAHNVTTFTATNAATTCYRMNDTKTELMLSTIDANHPLLPGEGFIVKATGDGASITFNPTAKGGGEVPEPVEGPTIQLDLLQNGLTIDRLIVKRDGEPLEKLTLRENGTKIYAQRDNQEMAVVPIEGNEQTVNFKAAKNGKYTITVNAENVEVAYLHLIDNMTGADVDVLASPNYTFTAKATDYESRFKLVFVTNEENSPSTGSETFAFVDASGNIVINGEGIVQVIDMMGRVVVSCGGHTRCVSTAGIPAGMYVLRLISGENIRTQKIVID